MITNPFKGWGNHEDSEPEFDSSRRANRFPIHAAVSLVLENGAVIFGTIKDMGTGGVFVATFERPFGLAVGEEGDLGLAEQDGSPDSEYRFPCKVVRIDREGVALQFLLETDSGHDKYFGDGHLR